MDIDELCEAIAELENRKGGVDFTAVMLSDGSGYIVDDEDHILYEWDNNEELHNVIDMIYEEDLDAREEED